MSSLAVFTLVLLLAAGQINTQFATPYIDYDFMSSGNGGINEAGGSQTQILGLPGYIN